MVILISMTHVYIINTINQEVNTIKLKTNETPLKISEWNTAQDQNQISVEILFVSKRSDIMIDMKDMIVYDSGREHAFYMAWITLKNKIIKAVVKRMSKKKFRV